MENDKFAAALATTGLRDRAAAAARLILVEGIGPVEAGRRLGFSREAARLAAKRVREAIEDDGLVAVTVYLPRGDTKHLRRARAAIHSIAALAGGR